MRRKERKKRKENSKACVQVIKAEKKETKLGRKKLVGRDSLVREEKINKRERERKKVYNTEKSVMLQQCFRNKSNEATLADIKVTP